MSEQGERLFVWRCLACERVAGVEPAQSAPMCRSHPFAEQLEMERIEVVPLATIESLRERVDETEAYAREGWEWLALALDAGGWATVFDIPDWQHLAALREQPQSEER